MSKTILHVLMIDAFKAKNIRRINMEKNSLKYRKTELNLKKDKTFFLMKSIISYSYIIIVRYLPIKQPLLSSVKSII